MTHVIVQDSTVVEGDEVPVYSPLVESSPQDTTILDENFGLPDSLSTDFVMDMALSASTSIWCQTCQSVLDGPCWQHGTTMSDQPVLPRALATLPVGLHFKSIPGTNETGVFAEVAVPVLTIFGPLCAPTTRWTVKGGFAFALTNTGGPLRAFSLDSDDLCNWMKYVRFAGNTLEQNAMVYEQDGQIFFTAVKVIQVGEEIRLGYSPKYGLALRKWPLQSPVAEGFDDLTSHQLPPVLEVNVDDVLEVDVAAVESVIKRSRGRPRKYKAAILPDLTNSTEQKLRGRGRPRKRPYTQVDFADELTSSFSALGDMAAAEKVFTNVLFQLTPAPDTDIEPDSGDTDQSATVGAAGSLMVAVEDQGEAADTESVTQDTHDGTHDQPSALASEQSEAPLNVRRSLRLRKTYAASTKTAKAPRVTKQALRKNENEGDLTTLQLPAPSVETPDGDFLIVGSVQRSRGRPTKYPAAYLPAQDVVVGIPSGPDQTVSLAGEPSPITGGASDPAAPETAPRPADMPSGHGIHRGKSRKRRAKQRKHLWTTKKKPSSCRPPRPLKEKKKRIRKRKYVSPATPALTCAKYRCDCPVENCPLKFRTGELLNIHALRHGTATVESITLTCPGCQLEFPTVEELQNHVDARHSKPLASAKLQCSKCLQCFNYRYQLTGHIRSQHMAPLERTVGCDQCGSKFVSVDSREKHRRTHFKPYYFTCPVCYKTFMHAPALKEHSESHMVDGVFACPLCHKSWTSFPRLRSHLRNTHSTKRLECDQCDLVFNRPYLLKKHMLVHSDQFDHVCEQCGRAFKRRSKMVEHVKAIHNLERIERRYNKSVQWIKMENVRRRAREKNYLEYEYKCEPCQVGFRRPALLATHMANIHPGDPLEPLTEGAAPETAVSLSFPCPHCDKAYVSSAGRKSHVKSAHADLVSYSEDGELLSSGRSTSGAFPAGVTKQAGLLAADRFPCQLCSRTYISEVKRHSHYRIKHPELNVR